ncbi:MAG: phosphoadenylyl-sulfate reductase [Betaproteobacteria bacterium]|nr:phosphoadenylyl-sulfate reductase [Betaproteobacteria bacterium]
MTSRSLPVTGAVPAEGLAARAQPAVVRHARAGSAHAALVEQALSLLRQAAREHAGQVVLSSSLGVEDMVLTDMVRRHQLDIPVATLDTGALHAQTLELLERAQRHYGIDIEVWRPQPQAVLQFVASNGADAMYRSVTLRHACCGVRKLEPLGRMLEGRTAWVTGLRREQSAQRSALHARQVGGDGRVKFSPLVDWSLGDVWQYVADFEVPYNALHDSFYPSIGCAPCTRAVTLGEDQRSGRWWWERDGEKECGLHLRGDAATTHAAPPSVSATAAASQAASQAAPRPASEPGAPA